jgi:hypothetical protein
MRRTQIYLTRDETEGLRSISGETGKSQSALIREAIDCYLALHLDHRDRMRKARGIWRTRTDLPNFERLRAELDREPPSAE